MLNKFETLYTKKLYNSLKPKKKKVKSIIPLTTLSPPQRIEVKRKIKYDNDNDLQLSKSLSFKVNNCQRVNYLRNTLTSSLYNILQNAEEKENEMFERALAFASDVIDRFMEKSVEIGRQFGVFKENISSKANVRDGVLVLSEYLNIAEPNV